MPTGETQRAALESVEQSTGRRPPELDECPLPWAGAHVVLWFNEIALGRQFSMAGPLPLSYQEIEAWGRLNGRRLLPWEVRAIKKLDRAWLEIPDPSKPTSAEGTEIA